MGKFVVKDGNGFERIVFGEVVIPDTPNVYGDFHTRESIRDFAYGFMLCGFGIDVDHDNVDVTGKVRIVESFIARDNDPDFIPGSWVVGCIVYDDEIWNKILSGDINGFSYEALISQLDVEAILPVDIFKFGVTEPDPVDGHYHYYFAVLDDDGRPISGGTTYTNQHRHDIQFHTVTSDSFGHNHRYNLIEAQEISA